MKKTNKRLHLERSTIRMLVVDVLPRAHGGQKGESDDDTDSSGTTVLSPGPSFSCPSEAVTHCAT